MNHLNRAADMVVAYLAAMEKRDLNAARSFVNEVELELVFPGNRKFSSLDAVVTNSSGRYRKIGKRISEREAWDSNGGVRVMITGTLYGEWPDGTPFEGIRFVDWFELRDGKIARQHVWNDSGEELLSRLKEAKQ